MSAECSINVHISPGARKNQVVEITSEGVTKIKISAPPVEGKANLALMKYLSNVLNQFRFQRFKLNGEKNHDNKLVKIAGISLEDATIRVENC